MRVVGWNVMKGGGPRIHRIAYALEQLDTDVVVLSEYLASNELSKAIADRGWVHQVGMPDPKPRGHGAVLIASRHRLREVGPRYRNADDEQRWVGVEVQGSEWTIGGGLVPAHDRSRPLRKGKFWDFVVNEFAPGVAERATLLIGDFNTGIHHVDEKGATFTCADKMAALGAAGWVDVWQAIHPNERPPSTWWEPTTGNGFRLDHAFLSPSSPAPIAIDYPSEIGGVRTTRAGDRKAVGERPWLSDHVPIVVDLA